MFNYNQSRAIIRDDPPAWVLVEELTTSHRKMGACYETFKAASEFDEFFGTTSAK